MKNKVFFIIPTLFAGGAERVISFVAENLNKEKFDVKLYVIGFEKDSKYDIKDLPVYYLNKSRVLHAFMPLVKILIQERPQIVVSSISHLNTMMGLISIFFHRIKFVGRHSTINKVAKKFRPDKKKSLLSQFVDLYSYGTKKLDYIICQSTDMKTDFLENYNYKTDNIWIIHNPITQMGVQKTLVSNNVNGVKRFITIGRLRKIKGHLRLLDILSNLQTPFEYTIIGDGDYKDEIFNKIEELKLKDQINYIQHTNNVYEHLVKHDMFLQGSYSEGFPNTLLESCTVGTPVIAFNVPGGTKEIVEDGVNGFLVNSEEEFLEKLNETKEWDPKTVAKSVYNKFGKEKILNEYEQFFTQILRK
ncbi:glycosyltransferase [Gelidibacter japonicus]|uniref:glycosyltransferase n=1 Tax=Gelidibacter japonicus TaxID=1962232 RepID=UPI0013D3C256|nr:glycosyltransferase [Gelidibacter japonicus]